MLRALLTLCAALALLAACNAPPDPLPSHATAVCNDGNPCTLASVQADLPVFEFRALPALQPELAVQPELAIAAPVSQAACVANHTERDLEMVGVASDDGGQLRKPLLEHQLIIGRHRGDHRASLSVLQLARPSTTPRSAVWLC